MCLTCNSFCKKCLTCSGRSYKQCALRKLCTYLLILFGIVQKIHELGYRFLCLVLACNIFKCDAGLFFNVIYLGVALSDTHDPAALA